METGLRARMVKKLYEELLQQVLIIVAVTG